MAPDRIGKNKAVRGEHPFTLGKRTTRRSVSDWAILAAAIVFGALIAAPFIIILINSFKSPADYATSGPLTLPHNLYFDGIAKFWQRVNFPEKLWNSFFISGTVSVLAVLISVFNAFAIGIGRVRGRTWIIILFLLANMLPQEALLYPLYYMFKQVGLYDNVWSVIIIFTVIQSAFGTYLLSSVYG
ncbi:MAG TPA: ABC transporter permease, partial [Microbacteriaceae bacterium]|nr:ABC transporter permease [Microbacteriaceae bacterium]